jgi:hypothetical protein
VEEKIALIARGLRWEPKLLRSINQVRKMRKKLLNGYMELLRRIVRSRRTMRVSIKKGGLKIRCLKMS